MPGQGVIQGAQPIEYIEETTYASPEASASWDWVGYVTSHSVSQEVEQSTFTFLPEADISNKLEQKRNIKVSESYSGDMTYHPTDFTFLELFTGTNGGTSSTIPSWQIGEQDEEGGEYRRLLGVVGEDWELSISEDSVAEVSASWMATDAEDWGTADYVNSSSITALDSSVAPETDQSVGVKTSSVTSGEIVVYDSSDNELGRTSASTSFSAIDVSGTTVVSVRLVNADSSFSSETITVNGETDGSGANNGTATVSSSGSHATNPGTDPFTYGDLSNIQLGGSDISGAVEELTLSISNDLTIVKDPNSTYGTNIYAIEITDREITVDLTLTYESFDMAQTVRDYSRQDLTFDFGGFSWTVADVQFPEFPYEMTPEDLVGDSVSSDPCTNLTWS